MGLEETSLIDVIHEFREKGFSEEFTIRDNQFFIDRLGMGFDQDQIIINGAFKFDISEEAIDTQNLFILSAPKFRIKGMLIDLMGMYTFMRNTRSPISSGKSLWRPISSMRMHPRTNTACAGYCLRSSIWTRTVFVLRKGFPDYPPCPIGNDFSMLVYDQMKEQYVWLVTSLLKDPRLKVEVYPS